MKCYNSNSNFEVYKYSFENETGTVLLKYTQYTQSEPFFYRYSKQPHHKLNFKYSAYFNKKSQNTWSIEPLKREGKKISLNVMEQLVDIFT